MHCGRTLISESAYVAVLAALPLIAAGGCYPHGETHALEESLPAVDVIRLRAEPATETVRLIGRIQPWREATLYFELPGVVDEVLVEDGHLVQPGDPVARLQREDYRLGLLRAEAERAAAEARLRLLESGTRKEDLEIARADTARAAAHATFWSSEHARLETLHAKNVAAVAESALDAAQRERVAAQQAERLAKAQLDRAIAGPRREEIDAARAEVEARRQAEALARRQLDKATLRAPFRGRVERRLVDPGAYVNVFPTGGVPIVHLVDLDRVDAVLAVPEMHLDRWKQLRQIEIVSAQDPGQRSTAEVVSLGKVADPASGTYELRARLANLEQRFTGGMVVLAESQVQVGRQAIRVPVAALCRAYGQQPYVLLVEPEAHRVVAREVRLGPVAGDRVEIVGGLTAGDLLIVRGQDRVVAGDRVKYQTAVALVRVASS